MNKKTVRQELVDYSVSRYIAISRREYDKEQASYITQGFESTAHLAVEAVLDGQGWPGCDTTTIGYAMWRYYADASELAVTRLFNQITREVPFRYRY